MNQTYKKFRSFFLTPVFISLFLFILVPSVNASACDHKENSKGILSTLRINPLAFFAEKVIGSFGYEVSLAAAPDPDFCGLDTIACSGGELALSEMARTYRGIWSDVAVSSTGQYQTAVVYGGQIYTSSDYGVTWVPRDSARAWMGVAVSSTGQYQTAVVSLFKIFTSSDYGATWTTRDQNREWTSIAISSTGQYQTAVGSLGKIYTSSNYGVTWTSRDSARAWMGVAVSSTGQYQTAVVLSGKIYTSSDYGATWTTRDQNREWTSIAISSTGQYQTAAVNGGEIYTSSDYGVIWFERDSNRAWRSIAISSTGQYQTAAVNGGEIYTSSDYGVIWVASTSGKSWVSVAMSSDAQYQTAVADQDSIYTLFFRRTVSGDVEAMVTIGHIDNAFPLDFYSLNIPNMGTFYSYLGIFNIPDSVLKGGMPGITYSWSSDAKDTNGLSALYDYGYSSSPSGSFTMPNCGPGVDIKANDSDGPITIAYNTSADLTWTSFFANSCNASGDWSGAKTLSMPIAPVKDNPTSAMMSQSGLLSFNAAGSIDGDTNTLGWSNKSPNGSWLKIDLGAGNEKEYVKLRMYANRLGGTYDIQYSDNGSVYTTVATTSVAKNWFEKTWDSAGKHRYWRLYLFQNTNKVLSREIREFELYKTGDPESTGNLTSSKTYTLTCAGPGGSDSDSVTVNVPAANQAPVAVATISKDGTSYTDSITVTQGVLTPVYLSASGSSDPDGWTDSANGVSSGGKCEWNRDLNSGAPIFELPWISNPGAPTDCNISLGNLVFNDPPGTYTYQVLRITDKPVAQSNVDTVSVTVDLAPVPDFTLVNSGNIYATVLKEKAGDSSETTITVTPYNGFSSSVSLSAINVSPSLPAGSTFSFDPVNLTQSKYSSGSQFKVHIGPGLAASQLYTITIQGVDGGLTRTNIVYLNVQVKNPGWIEF